jgi:hypothetical protein
MSDTKQIKFVDEVVYECDTNLPIRLLFILNSMPLLKGSDEEIQEIKFASGRPIDLCDKLIEIDRKDQKEGGEVEEKNVDISVSSEPEESQEVSESEYESEEESSFYETS